MTKANAQALHDTADRLGWSVNWGPDDESEGQAEVCELLDANDEPIAFRRGLQPANAAARGLIEAEMIAEALAKTEVSLDP